MWKIISGGQTGVDRAALDAARALVGWRSLEVDTAGRQVRLALPGMRLDLGGIAKGWAADRICAMLSSAGPALVDAGGDLVGTGRSWPIGVATPTGTITLGVRDGALATSGRDRRRWIRNGYEAHHVIDPGTGAPAHGDVLTVTVAARTAAEAEVLATALFLSGEANRAAREADSADVPAVIVARDGRTLFAGGLA